jgi:hypothetical protein
MIELLLCTAVLVGLPLAAVYLFDGVVPKETVACACGRHSTTAPVYVHDVGHRRAIVESLTEYCPHCWDHRNSSSASSVDTPRSEASA